MSDEFNLISIGSVNLTKDGTGTGIPCMVETNGVAGLWLDYDGATARSTNGTPYNFIAENLGIGKIIRIKPLVVAPDVLDDIKDEINLAIANETTVNITIAGETGDYDLDCLPYFENDRRPLEASGKFGLGQIYDVEITMVTQAVNA